MDKAERAAQERYPSFTAENINEVVAARNLFAKGYRQAEADLELTWQDMKAIVDIAHDIEPLRDGDNFLFEFQTEEGFYKEVLKRFKEGQKQ